jgi:hypothetical protein
VDLEEPRETGVAVDDAGGEESGARDQGRRHQITDDAQGRA